MDVLKNVLVLLHLLGFAAIFAGSVTQWSASAPKINRFIMDGAWTQLLTGVLLVWVNESGPDPVNHVKVGIKLLVLVAIVVLAFMNRKKESVGSGLVRGILGLTVLNAAIAVLWT